MSDFLSNHFRYRTGNYASLSSSYAQNMKITNFNFPDNAFNILERYEVGDAISCCVENFTYENSGFTCYFNGRSGGYLVLHVKPGEKSLVSAAGIDEGEDFSSWDIYDLKGRVKLIQSFDQLCDDIVSTFRYFCENYVIVKDEEGKKIFVEKHLICPILAIKNEEYLWKKK